MDEKRAWAFIILSGAGLLLLAGIFAAGFLPVALASGGQDTLMLYLISNRGAAALFVLAWVIIYIAVRISPEL